MNKKPASKPSKDKASISNKKASSIPIAKNLIQEEVAVRAYFISEERQRKGLNGDHLSDWMEAERQLSAER